MRYLLSLLLLLFCISAYSLPDPWDEKYAWMDLLVEKDFDFFKEGIFEEQILETLSLNHNISHLKVIDNEVYVSTKKSPSAFGMLTYLTHSYGLPDLDILHFEEDGIEGVIAGGAPLFCSSKLKKIKQALYFIDWYTKLPHPTWDKIVERINRAVEESPWEEKKEQLVWRGGTTDGWYTPSNWMTLRRGKLCHLSLLYPHLIDARFVDIYTRTSDTGAKLKKLVPKGRSMSFEEQVRYKYQIVLDGLFTTYPGDRWRLISNSVVFMHESEFGHWFYEALIPWVHYVPLKSDLSDLIENLLFIQAQPELAQEIASNAREFALNYLLTEHIAVYCYKALLKYASLQKFSPCKYADDGLMAE